MCVVCRDRKRKRFIGEGTEANKKKKIKTESGHWIDATYKSGMYPSQSLVQIRASYFKCFKCF